MLDGSREAPTTATAAGASIGRSDAAVAARSRSSAACTPFADGVSDSCRSTAPPELFDRISNPESRNTSSIGVLSVSVDAWNRSKPWRAAMTASRSNSIDPSPLPWKRSSTAKATSATRSLTDRYEAVAIGRRLTPGGASVSSSLR